MMQPGLAVVISSPSGTGKTTICRRLVKKHNDYQLSVSATTRLPRGNEQDGIDYHFMTDKQFLKAKRMGMFIEKAKYLDHWYGTPKKPLLKSIAEGKVVLLDIDVQGGKSIKKSIPGAVSIFLVPPDLTELKRRLKSRKTENSAVRKKRMNAAISELENWLKYEYLVVNDNLKIALDEIVMIINSERRKTSRLADRRYWKKSLANLLGLMGTRR